MPDIFEVADLHVALGGDTLNTVPRFGCTAAEIAVLQVIHGGDAVHDIIPRGTIERSQRVERERLKAVYGTARDNNGTAHVEKLYPGAAARVFERLDELDLADAQFKSAPLARGTGTAREAARLADADEGAALVGATNQNQPLPIDPEEAAAGLDELPADDKPGVLD